MVKLRSGERATFRVQVPNRPHLKAERSRTWMPLAASVGIAAATAGLGAEAYHMLRERRRMREEEALLPFPVRR